MSTHCSSKGPVAASSHVIGLWPVDNVKSNVSGFRKSAPFKTATNVAPMTDSLDVPSRLLSVAHPPAIHAMQSKGPRHASNLQRACEMPQNFKPRSYPTASAHDDMKLSPTGLTPAAGSLSKVSCSNTLGDHQPAQQSVDGPCCEFDNIDLSFMALQDWLRHVNDVRNLPPLPREQLQDPAPLAEGVWLGSLRHADKIADLKSCGICAIVNMLGPWWQREARNGMKPEYPKEWEYLEVQVQDMTGVNILQDHFARIYKFMQHCHHQKKPIFVHCRMGINRSVTICVAFLMYLLKWPLPQALHHVVCRRPKSLGNVTFQSELIKLAKVNGLLYRVPRLEELVRKVEAPLLHVWRAAQSGKHGSLVHVERIIDVLKSLGAAGLCLGLLEGDLFAIANTGGFISWEQFEFFVINDMDTGVRSSIINLFQEEE